MKSKKVVFFLLLGLVSCALGTLLVHKFELIKSHGPVITEEESMATKLLKGHKSCLLTAGIKLDLVPTEHVNQYKVQSLTGLPLELKGQINEGDLILGPQLMVSGNLIGEQQSLVVKDSKTGNTHSLLYTVQPVLDCK